MTLFLVKIGWYLIRFLTKFKIEHPKIINKHKFISFKIIHTFKLFYIKLIQIDHEIYYKNGNLHYVATCEASDGVYKN